uniref:VP4 n=1 Tax=Blackberry latent virus TaxID=3231626 RepID=A0AAU8HZR9_9REOV
MHDFIQFDDLLVYEKGHLAVALMFYFGIKFDPKLQLIKDHVLSNLELILYDISDENGFSIMLNGLLACYNMSSIGRPRDYLTVSTNSINSLIILYKNRIGAVHWFPIMDALSEGKALESFGRFKFAATHITWSFNCVHYVEFQDESDLRTYLFKKMNEQCHLNNMIQQASNTVPRYIESVAINLKNVTNLSKMLWLLGNSYIPVEYNKIISDINILRSNDILLKLLTDLKVNYGLCDYLNFSIVCSDKLKLATMKKDTTKYWPFIKSYELIQSDLPPSVSTIGINGSIWIDIPTGNSSIPSNYKFKLYSDVNVAQIKKVSYEPDFTKKIRYDRYSEIYGVKALYDSDKVVLANKKIASTCYINYYDSTSERFNVLYNIKSICKFNDVYKDRLFNRISQFLQFKLLDTGYNDELGIELAIGLNISLNRNSPNRCIIPPSNVVNISGSVQETSNSNLINKELNASVVKIVSLFCVSIRKIYYNSESILTIHRVDTLPMKVLLVGEISGKNKEILSKLGGYYGFQIKVYAFGYDGFNNSNKCSIEGVQFERKYNVVISDVDQANEINGFEGMVNKVLVHLSRLLSATSDVLYYKCNHPSLYLINLIVNLYKDTWNISLLHCLGQKSFTTEIFICFQQINTNLRDRIIDKPYFTRANMNDFLFYENQYNTKKKIDLSKISGENVLEYDNISPENLEKLCVPGNYTFGSLNVNDAAWFISLALKLSDQVLTWSTMTSLELIHFYFTMSNKRYGVTKRRDDIPVIRPHNSLTHFGSFGINLDKNKLRSIFKGLSSTLYCTLAYRYEIASDIIKQKRNNHVHIIGVREGSEIGYYPKDFKVTVYEELNLNPYIEYNVEVRNLWDWNLDEALKKGCYIFNYVIMSNAEGESSKVVQVGRLETLFNRLITTTDKDVYVYLSIYRNPLYLEDDTQLPKMIIDYTVTMSDRIKVRYFREGDTKNMYVTFGQYDPVYAFRENEILTLIENANEKSVGKKIVMEKMKISQLSLLKGINTHNLIPNYLEWPDFNAYLSFTVLYKLSVTV